MVKPQRKASSNGSNFTCRKIKIGKSVSKVNDVLHFVNGKLIAEQ